MLAPNARLRACRREAAETVWALAGPDLHTFPGELAGGSRKRYAAWLADTLSRARFER